MPVFDDSSDFHGLRVHSTLGHQFPLVFGKALYRQSGLILRPFLLDHYAAVIPL
jgi:hypothetical protein